METAVKAEVNGGGPLPQRPQKNAGGVNKSFSKPQMDGGPAEKKPRFNQNNGSNNQGNRGGFGNKGFGNNMRNNRNRGGGSGGGTGNRGNFQNQVRGIYLRLDYIEIAMAFLLKVCSRNQIF